ncbi:E3 ubiquitin-protein ligase RNF181-like [Oryza brachyantha]|uniref:E3 ubiquitin-protein ligase RNF181-like n=1 Tax=Oryza brachyantha TaxID=4533 RepID=UPI0003EABECD|nr:E3 ubiquitin-protein ligase RNF181-like [Oryza brachyantha]
MASAFDLDAAMLMGDVLEVMDVDGEEEASNGGGIIPDGFAFGPPGVAIGAAATGFRLTLDVYDTDLEFVEVVGDADAGVSARPSPAASPLTAVESLPEAALSEEEASRGCAVCMDCFASGQLVAPLPCRHCFHGDCIRPWLAIRNTCPVCRRHVRTDDDPGYEQRMARRAIVLAPVEHHQDASTQVSS